MTIKRIAKTHHHHHDQADCGVVCLKSILNYYKSDLYIEQLREWSGTNKTGTTMLGLLQCAKKIGFNAEGFEADIESLKTCNNLCILHILKDNILQHYVVFYSYNSKDNTFLIGDSAKTKPTFITEKELKNLWQSKALLLLKPTDKLPKPQKDNKLKWIIASIKQDQNILIMALLLGIIISILGLASAIFSQKFIDVLLPSNNFNKILYGSLLLLFIMLLNTFLSYLKQLFLIRQGKLYNIRIINFFYSKLLHLPKPFFDTRKTGDLVARMNDTNRIQSTITSFISSIIVNLIMVIVSTIAIFNYNWEIGILSLLWIPIFLVIVLLFHTKILKAQKFLMQSYAQNESNYIDTIKGIEAIKINNKQNNFIELTKKFYSNYKENSYTLGKISLSYQFTTQTIGAIFIVGLIIYASHLVINYNFTSGGVIAILQLSSLLMGSIGGLAMLNIQLQEAKVALNRMFEYTNINEEKTSNINTDALKIESLELKNITFGYPGRQKLINNISVIIKKGECLGVVGEIGSGKSTLLQIIQKFYNQNLGEIIINKTIKLQDIELKNWRDCLGVVSQHSHIFTGNIFYNIVLEENYNKEQVIAFCKSYGFDTFIDSLPQNYFTIVGEEGINLSGGQRQIIALARALYNKPQLLLLDEVTASMDLKTEGFVLNLLQKLKKDILIIFVSHRLDALNKIADKILNL
jgi:ATP-binding cassette subfamily B protein